MASKIQIVGLCHFEDHCLKPAKKEIKIYINKYFEGNYKKANENEFSVFLEVNYKLQDLIDEISKIKNPNDAKTYFKRSSELKGISFFPGCYSIPLLAAQVYEKPIKFYAIDKDAIKSSELHFLAQARAGKNQELALKKASEIDLEREKTMYDKLKESKYALLFIGKDHLGKGSYFENKNMDFKIICHKPSMEYISLYKEIKQKTRKEKYGF